jgi:hypothetical protein
MNVIGAGYDRSGFASGKLRSMRLLYLALAAALLLSCSDSSDDASPATFAGTVTKTVGPDGATIEVGGATVTIPKGALDRSVDITITASDEAPPEGFIALSKVFECGPSGTSFLQGVTMNMPFTNDGSPATMFWSSGADPTFKDVGGVPNGGTMSAAVMHFSSGFVGRKK